MTDTSMTDTSSVDAAANARHAEKMKKVQVARARMMATKTVEKGLLIVHTGTGKGKTSAALGMVFRHIGHGMPVAVVQFTKAESFVTGEALLLRRFPDFSGPPDPPAWRRSMIIRGPEALRIQLA